MSDESISFFDTIADTVADAASAVVAAVQSSVGATGDAVVDAFDRMFGAPADAAPPVSSELPADAEASEEPVAEITPVDEPPMPRVVLLEDEVPPMPRVVQLVDEPAEAVRTVAAPEPPVELDVTDVTDVVAEAPAPPFLDADRDGLNDIGEDDDDDNDGIDDRKDFDRDNDGFEELSDPARIRDTTATGTRRDPVDAVTSTSKRAASAFTSDLDGDGIDDRRDDDLDGDGVRNLFDLDDDNDGSLDLVDRDDDGDGFLDLTEKSANARAKAQDFAGPRGIGEVIEDDDFDPAQGTAPDVEPPTTLLGRAGAFVDEAVADAQDGIAALGAAVTGDDDFGSGSGRTFDVFEASTTKRFADEDGDGRAEVKVTGRGNQFREARPSDILRIAAGDLDHDGTPDEQDDNIDGDDALDGFDIDDDNDGVPDARDPDADGDGFEDSSEHAVEFGLGID